MLKIFFGSEALEIKNLKIPKECNINESISYEVWGMPECEFDQHVRARIGIKFERIKNDDKIFILYPSNKNYYQNNKTEIEDFLNESIELEKINHSFSLMSRHTPYKVEQTLESLIGQMNRRLMFCEEIFIVSVHWKLREMLLNHVDANTEFKNWVEQNCKLACDLAKFCVYSNNDFLSNSFGCLFAGCGRWKDEINGAPTFNHSCTTAEEIEKYLSIKIYKSEYEIKNNLRN